MLQNLEGSHFGIPHTIYPAFSYCNVLYKGSFSIYEELNLKIVSLGSQAYCVEASTSLSSPLVLTAVPALPSV